MYAPIMQCGLQIVLGRTGPVPTLSLATARKVFCEFKKQSLLYDACGCSQYLHGILERPSMAKGRYDTAEIMRKNDFGCGML